MRNTGGVGWRRGWGGHRSGAGITRATEREARGLEGRPRTKLTDPHTFWQRERRERGRRRDSERGRREKRGKETENESGEKESRETKKE